MLARTDDRSGACWPLVLGPTRVAMAKRVDESQEVRDPRK